MKFRNSKWETTLIEENNGIPRTLTWKCENTREDIEQKITTKLKEEKIFPQENYEYEGNINGKEVKGRATTGHGAMQSIYAVKENEELTKAEQYAGLSHIRWFM